MVSQNKILLSLPDYNKETNIPIGNEQNKNIIFTIKENDTAIITNKSNEYIICIENVDSGEQIYLRKDESSTINNSDHSNPPMNYLIKIINKTNNSSKNYFYKIEPLKATNTFQYKNMISTISEYDEKLLFEDDVKYLYGKRIYKSSYRQFYLLIKFIVENFKILNNSLIDIYNNPLLKEKRIISKSQKIKRQTSKSIIKNNKSIGSDSFYSSQIVSYADFGLNRYLLNILNFSVIRLMNLKNYSHIELDKLENKVKRILSTSNDNLYKRKPHTQYQIESLENKINLIKLFLEHSNILKNSIDRILLSETFKGVSLSKKRDNLIVHYSKYLNIERTLYLPLFQSYTISFINSYNSILASPIKPTYKLFELYCLLIIENTISELGFENIYPGEIYSDHIIKKYKYESYEIELMYEVNAKDVSEANVGEIHYLNAHHISPDFYLILKKDNIPVLFLVLDAKCSKPYSINKKIVEKNYDKTIRDYLSLRYSTNENVFKSPKVVDYVWLLMIDDNENNEYNKFQKLEYSFIKLELDGTEDKFVEKFLNFINNYLK